MQVGGPSQAAQILAAQNSTVDLARMAEATKQLTLTAAAVDVAPASGGSGQVAPATTMDEAAIESVRRAVGLATA